MSSVNCEFRKTDKVEQVPCPSELKVETPANDVYSEIREKWKARDYANLPLKGLCLLNEENGSHSSIMTTGGHPYFHFHAGVTGEEAEEVELHDRPKFWKALLVYY